MFGIEKIFEAREERRREEERRKEEERRRKEEEERRRREEEERRQRHNDHMVLAMIGMMFAMSIILLFGSSLLGGSSDASNTDSANQIEESQEQQRSESSNSNLSNNTSGLTATYAKSKGLSNLEAYFLDVGQGDCEFLKLPDGKTMLIDAGGSGAASTVIAFLEGEDVSRIDYVVATCPDEDHISSMDDVLAAFNVGEVWMPDASKDTDAVKDLVSAIQAKGLTAKEAKVGEEIAGEESGYGIDLLGPQEELQSDDSNDYSAVVRVTYGDTSMLFPGDATAQEIVDDNPGHVDVLKVARHGSEAGTDAAVTEALAPEYVIMSYADGNPYGYPNQSVLDAVKTAGARAYSTAVNGNVKAISNGTRVYVFSSRSGTVTAGMTAEEREQKAAEERAQAEAEAKAQAEAESEAQRQQEAEAQAQAEAQRQQEQEAAEAEQKAIVYITRTGSKYHLPGCRTLSRSKSLTEMTKQQAIAAGYTACAVCNP